MTRTVEQPPPLPGADVDPPTQPGRRRTRKGFAPLARAGGVRLGSTVAYVIFVALWWPAMWKIGMPIEWAVAGLTALGAAIGGLQVGDTVRPSGTARAEEG